MGLLFIWYVAKTSRVIAASFSSNPPIYFALCMCFSCAWSMQLHVPSMLMLLFQILPSLSHPQVLEGVDTAAEIRVNGATVGHAANMHAQHMLDITSPLRDGSVRNTLEIALTSALAYGAAKEASYPYTVPRNVHVGSLPHRQFVRKTQVCP